MAYDIYGNNLQKGYCEVHPQVHEEYPCSLCFMDDDRRNREKQQGKQQEKEYYNALERHRQLNEKIDEAQRLMRMLLPESEYGESYEAEALWNILEEFRNIK